MTRASLGAATYAAIVVALSMFAEPTMSAESVACVMGCSFHECPRPDNSRELMHHRRECSRNFPLNKRNEQNILAEPGHQALFQK